MILNVALHDKELHVVCILCRHFIYFQVTLKMHVIISPFKFIRRRMKHNATGIEILPYRFLSFFSLFLNNFWRLLYPFFPYQNPISMHTVVWCHGTSALMKPFIYTGQVWKSEITNNLADEKHARKSHPQPSPSSASKPLPSNNFQIRKLQKILEK